MEEESAFAEEVSPGPKFTFPKEYGTITEFYFMLAETIHYGLMPIVKRGEDVYNLFQKILEEKDNMSESHPEYHQMKAEFENIQRYRMLYQITLFDKQLIREVNNFFKIQFDLIKKWGKFDEKN